MSLGALSVFGVQGIYTEGPAEKRFRKHKKRTWGKNETGKKGTAGRRGRAPKWRDANSAPGKGKYRIPGLGTAAREDRKRM